MCVIKESARDKLFWHEAIFKNGGNTLLAYYERQLCDHEHDG